MNWYMLSKEIIEIVYMLSGVGIIIGLFLAYKQLKLMRDDYNTKNERASIEKSIEYLHLFATTYIPLASNFLEKLRENDVPVYKGPKNKEFRFDDNCREESKYIKQHVQACLDLNGVNVLNQFEFFSAAMMSGLADEELTFTPLAEFYCTTVEHLYVTLCYTRRKDSSNSFSNTIALYNVWKPRLEKHELERSRDKLDERISKIEPKNIQSLWKVK